MEKAEEIENSGLQVGNAHCSLSRITGNTPVSITKECRKMEDNDVLGMREKGKEHIPLSTTTGILY